MEKDDLEIEEQEDDDEDIQELMDDYDLSLGEAKKVKRIMDEAWQRAHNIILEKRNVLDVIAVELMRVENIEREEFEKLLLTNGIIPKRKKEEELISL